MTNFTTLATIALAVVLTTGAVMYHRREVSAARTDEWRQMCSALKWAPSFCRVKCTPDPDVPAGTWEVLPKWLHAPSADTIHATHASDARRANA